MKNKPIHPSMEGPAIYRIRVEGNISTTLSSRLEGMNITAGNSEKGEAESVLVGRLADQAALAGLLNTLYELHHPVLSVDCLEAG
jgi:hypothetical protein